MSQETELIFRDFINNKLEIGDIVVRSLYSGFTFHRVLKFNKKSIKLSCGFLSRQGWRGSLIWYKDYAKNPDEIDLEEYNNSSFNLYTDRTGICYSLLKHSQ